MRISFYRGQFLVQALANALRFADEVAVEIEVSDWPDLFEKPEEIH